MAISVDPPQESRKLNQLLNGTFPLLSDPSLRVISAYGMLHQMGSSTVGNMGYAIVDGSGVLRHRAEDPLFGRRADEILAKLQALKGPS